MILAMFFIMNTLSYISCRINVYLHAILSTITHEKLIIFLVEKYSISVKDVSLSDSYISNLTECSPLRTAAMLYAKIRIQDIRVVPIIVREAPLLRKSCCYSVPHINMASSGMRSMESNHKPIVILRCKLVIVGENLTLWTLK